MDLKVTGVVKKGGWLESSKVMSVVVFEMFQEVQWDISEQFRELSRAVWRGFPSSFRCIISSYFSGFPWIPDRFKGILGTFIGHQARFRSA